jgi:hypothetical protein
VRDQSVPCVGGRRAAVAPLQRDHFRPRGTRARQGEPQGGDHRREDPRATRADLRRAEPAMGDRPRRSDLPLLGLQSRAEGTGGADDLSAAP